MLKRIIKKSAMYFVIVLIAYLVVGYLFHWVIFPENKPDVATYFKPGQTFYSKAEGIHQTVVKHEKGQVYCSTIIDPLADGPPKHIHTDFDERFEVASGELSVWLDGKIVKLRPGDTLFVPRGTPHKPFNETNETIIVKDTIAFPEQFAYYLTQVYGMMDNDPDFGKNSKTAFQMALFSSAGFDSYLFDGPPVLVQKTTGLLLTPIIRLMGYKSFYSEYDIRKNQKSNLNISKR